MEPSVRFGSLADILAQFTLTAALGWLADIKSLPRVGHCRLSASPRLHH
jgi:hypothetical protein